MPEEKEEGRENRITSAKPTDETRGPDFGGVNGQ